MQPNLTRDVKAQVFRTNLLQWFSTHERPLPWKSEKNPYYIWLSEIILQQTRVEQGLPYFLKFKEQYPDIFSLANAPEDEVMKLWEGLGYYTRGRNLHKTAKIIAFEKGGVFPSAYEDILALPGVGHYTAAAIASFAFGLPYAVLDGNVYRVLSRYFEEETPVDAPDAKKVYTDLANRVLDTKRPGDFNQAIMDLGATVCVPVNPWCPSCPLHQTCEAFLSDRVNQLPVKLKKTVHRYRYFNYFIINQGENTYIRKREAGDIWQSLYEFPMIETAVPSDAVTLKEMPEWRNFWGENEIKTTHIFGPARQTLTHQKIIGMFHEVILNTDYQPFNHDWIKIEKKYLSNYAFPKIITWYFENKFLPLKLF